jgi:hypothetical protein
VGAAVADGLAPGLVVALGVPVEAAGGEFDPCGARGTAVGDGRSDGLSKLLAGVFSKSGGLALAGRCRAASLLSGTGAAAGEAVGAGLGCIGVSTLPRMTGSPSLPLPMITILVFGDCASCSVASMPRQRT